MKLRTAQPTAVKALPEQDRIHLPGELVHPPHAIVLNDFAVQSRLIRGDLKGQSCYLAEEFGGMCTKSDILK